jgi:quinol monooxygenase YgiN
VLIHNFLLQYTVNKNVVLLQEEFEDTKRVKEAVKTEEGQNIRDLSPGLLHEQHDGFH